MRRHLRSHLHPPQFHLRLPVRVPALVFAERHHLFCFRLRVLPAPMNVPAQPAVAGHRHAAPWPKPFRPGDKLHMRHADHPPAISAPPAANRLGNLREALGLGGLAHAAVLTAQLQAQRVQKLRRELRHRCVPADRLHRRQHLGVAPALSVEQHRPGAERPLPFRRVGAVETRKQVRPTQTAQPLGNAARIAYPAHNTRHAAPPKLEPMVESRQRFAPPAPAASSRSPMAQVCDLAAFG